MKYDGSLDIALGMSVNSKIWKNTKMPWSKLVHKLSEDHKTRETFKEYLAASKDDQTKIKDVGAYVGGYLRQGKRHPQNVLHRQVITLDIDFAYLDFWSDFCLQFDNAAVLHATHKHHETSPRFRLVLPMSREASPDEYVAVSRKIAGELDIELFDNTTFETNRLMFWPSTPKDIEYYFRFQDGPFIDVDEVLASYVDWTDSSAWPTAARQFDSVKTNAEKQEDPENKKGIVGAFCRTYGIEEAISLFLSEVYSKVGDDRYTYTKGTTAGGLMVYGDKFAYSHHGTDPCGGKLSNSFDLVRIHKFGHLDTENHHGKNTKSYQAMELFARDDKQVRKIIATENLKQAEYDFVDLPDFDAESMDWMQDLEVDGKGKYLSNANNVNLIFANDIRLKGLFKWNAFDTKSYIFGNMPWRKISQPEPIKDVDFAGVRNYIETIYGISNKLKIDDALALEFERNAFHPIRDYLKNLTWDGNQRVDYLLSTYFGVPDSTYTREAMRKMLVGSVARVYKPGCKFDLVLTLISQQQGTGKSSFFKALGGAWFSDTFMTVNGKEALEQIQGAWIIEMAELSGVRKTDVESVKHFISKQEDMFRKAYGRTAETYKRQCVFVATTNQVGFLKDASGNRRFLPVDVQPVKLAENIALKILLKDQNTIDQIWAEAVHLYKKGEPLFLSKEAETEAETEQKKHSEFDERTGIVEEYLAKELPANWAELDIDARRMYLTDPLSPKGMYQREYVCGLEVWCECFGRAKEDASRYNTREINEMLRGLEDWEFSNSTKNFPIYGKQKYYTRKNDLF